MGGIIIVDAVQTLCFLGLCGIVVYLNHRIVKIEDHLRMIDSVRRNSDLVKKSLRPGQIEKLLSFESADITKATTTKQKKNKYYHKRNLDKV